MKNLIELAKQSESMEDFIADAIFTHSIPGTEYAELRTKYPASNGAKSLEKLYKELMK